MIVHGTSRDSSYSWMSALAVVERRKYWLVLPSLTGIAIGLAGYATTPSTFVSEAVVALDVRRVHALPTETVVSPLPQDSPVLRTELDVISSRTMAAKVLQRLERDGVVVDRENDQGRLLSGIWRLVNEWFQASAEGASAEATIAGRMDEREKIDQLLSRLRVSNDGRSYTIFLSYSSSDPGLAAQVANAYASEYLEHQIEVQRTATRRVSDWLGETLINLRAGLESSEQAAEAFRQEEGLVRTNGATLQAQRVSALSSELAGTRAVYAGMQARLETIKSLASKEGFPSLSEILGSETVQALRIEEARLERRLRELKDSKAEKSLELSTLVSALASLKQQIGEEIERIVDSLTNELAILTQKEKSLEAALQDAHMQLSTANHAEVTLAQLERESTANRTIYESYLVRYKQTIEQDGIAAPEAQIISLAEPASRPAKPRLSAWLLFGMGFGGSVAVAGAALREMTDRRHRLREMLEDATGVPIIGALPRLNRGGTRRMAGQARNGSTKLGRSLSTIRKLLRITPAGKHSVAVMVASTFPNEGKTTLAVGLARSAAAAGMKTVVVDANLREPGLEAIFGRKADAYLDELAGANKSTTDLVQRLAESGVCFIAARKHAMSPELLLASPRLKGLVNELKLRFDVVLIDTPDLATAPDALDIAAVADRVLYVADFKSPRVQPILASIRSLAACGHRPDGIVLNRVDSRSHLELSEYLLHPAAIHIDVIGQAGGNTIKQTA